MSKSVDQILYERRMENQRRLDDRFEEVYKKQPRIKDIDKEIKELNLQRIDYRIRGIDDKLLESKLKSLKAERLDLLGDLGLDDSYLKMTYHCNICKDKGIYKGKSCQCRKKLLAEKLYDQSMIYERISKENFSTFNINLFRKSRQENEPISPYENMKSILEAIRNYLNKFEKGATNLYFFGNVGTGKTFMINCIAKELMDKGVSVLYQSSGELLEFLNSYIFMFNKDKAENKSKLDLIFDVDVLIIDDLGAEYKNDVSLANLFEVINKRLVANKTTIISSNISIFDLDSVYDKRISSRIMGEYQPLRFYGNDIRTS